MDHDDMDARWDRAVLYAEINEPRKAAEAFEAIAAVRPGKRLGCMVEGVGLRAPEIAPRRSRPRRAVLGAQAGLCSSRRSPPRCIPGLGRGDRPGGRAPSPRR